MARARFKNKNTQREFFRKVLQKSGYTSGQLADACGVAIRTLADWRRGKYLPKYEAVIVLGKKFKISLSVASVDDYSHTWKAGIKGAKARFKKYGLLGTTESRSRGGVISQQRRREDPEKYRALGCITRKKFSVPEYSEPLAELVGVILGDGTITKYQVKVFLDRKRDKEYAIYVADLMGSLFREWPSIIDRPAEGLVILTLSGANLIENLEKIGLQRGDKILHQVSFPEWIEKNMIYRAACVRGLFDTDGGLYFHQKAKKKYLGWCFASFSEPLLDAVARTLRELRFNVKKVGKHKLYMYSLKDIFRYLDFIGSSNPKNQARLNVRLGIADNASIEQAGEVA